jgi:hypothetical protein
MASFHSKDNYETLRDIISEVYPIKTNDGLHGVYDTNFRVFSPPSNHSLLAANQLFLEKVMRNLDIAPKKINIQQHLDIPIDIPEIIAEATNHVQEATQTNDIQQKNDIQQQKKHVHFSNDVQNIIVRLEQIIEDLKQIK